MSAGDRASDTKRRVRVQILHIACVGCRDCVERCPVGALAIQPTTGMLEADENTCVGCRICERVCAYAAIRIDGLLDSTPTSVPLARVPDPVEGDIAEVQPGLSGLDQARVEAERCLQCPDPSCVWGCPAHNDIPGFIASVRAGNLSGASRVLGETSCLAGTCARVCDALRQCEGACALALAGGEPVAIKLLERFVADSAGGSTPAAVMGLSGAGAVASGISVAIVGSGPAGLAAALWLLSAGARVELLESEPELGGVLRWGMPRYELASDVWSPLVRVLERERRLRVCVSTKVGLDVEIRNLLERHDAVLLAHGASVVPELRVAGGDQPGVMDAMTFLRGADGVWDPSGSVSGDELRGVSVLAVGGGDTAMAVSRMALRLGARAITVRRSQRSKAAVRVDELDQALAEGVDARFGIRVERLEVDGTKVGAAVLERLGAPRWCGVMKFRTRANNAARMERLACDLVVASTGFGVDTELFGAAGVPAERELAVRDGRSRRRGSSRNRALVGASGLNSEDRDANARRIAREVLATEAMLATSDRRLSGSVWAAGDALTGPSSVVWAMASGHRAALGIVAALGNKHADRHQLPEE